MLPGSPSVQPARNMGNEGLSVDTQGRCSDSRAQDSALTPWYTFIESFIESFIREKVWPRKATLDSYRFLPAIDGF